MRGTGCGKDGRGAGPERDRPEDGLQPEPDQRGREHQRLVVLRAGNAVRQKVPAAAARRPAGNTRNGKKAAWANGSQRVVSTARSTAPRNGTAAAPQRTRVAAPTALAAAT